MRILNFYPLKGSFKPGENITFKVVVGGRGRRAVEIRLTIMQLDAVVDTVCEVISEGDDAESGAIGITWIPHDGRGGFGVKAELLNKAGQVVDTAVSAFDILESWTAYPRYGFLSDFTPGRTDIETDIETLAMFHINGLQFYDWQYRHDCLLPPSEAYIDPLGRELSLSTVQQCIEAAHQFGMAAMPYLAVYAASLTFWEAHPEWALYDEKGQPLTFIDFLGMMDPSDGRPWSTHLQNEGKKVLEALPFDGLHVDQYGDPKEAFDVNGEPVDIPEAFSQFIVSLKKAHVDQVITFNAVGNWPIEALAKTPQDFVYIEIWPPKTQYSDLVDIVLNARRLSGGKAVVIALYLPARRIINVRLADALIFSCGGARIELGEGNRLLTDPYFPNHEAISTELNLILRRYYDFAVRYQALIGPAAKAVESWSGEVSEGIWHVARQSAGRITLCLVNFCGVDEQRWDVDHAHAEPQKNVKVTWINDQPVRRVLWASADSRDPALQPINWQTKGNKIEVTIPELTYWAILTFEIG